MTVGEAIEKAPREKVYLGANNGPAFGFCGDKSAVQIELVGVNAEILRLLHAVAKKRALRARFLASSLSCHSNSDDIMQLRAVTKSVVDALKEVDEFIPIQGRQVVSQYPTITPGSSAWIILFDGTEKGRYWYEGDTGGETGGKKGAKKHAKEV